MCQVELQDIVNGCRGVHVEDVSEGLVKSVGRPYSLPLLPFQGLQTCVQLFLACFGSVVSLENHVKTMEKCMYFWVKLKALGPGVGNSVIEGF